MRGMKILYVDENPLKHSRYVRRNLQQQQQIFVSGLSKHYPVQSLYDLFSEEFDREMRKGWDALITHLPHVSLNYELALYKLRELKSNRILVYTGASSQIMSDDIIREAGISAVIRKDDPLRDIIKVRKVLDDWFSRSQAQAR